MSVVERLITGSALTPRSRSVGATRAGPPLETVLRKDRWWVSPRSPGSACWLHRLRDLGGVPQRELLRRHSSGRDYLSPLYSPCLTNELPARGTSGGRSRRQLVAISPALLILIFPLGIPATCYYYRKAYYRSFWLSPAGVRGRRRRLDQAGGLR